MQEGRLRAVRAWRRRGRRRRPSRTGQKLPGGGNLMLHRRIALVSVVAACALAIAVPATASATAWKAKPNTAATTKSLDEVKKQLADLKVTVSKLDSQSGIVSLLAAAAPQLVDGLTQLKNGLTTLGDASQSVEYGVAAVNVVGGGSIVNPPGWSADIPDD